MPKPTLESIKDQTAKYSDETYGSDRGHGAPLIYLKKEADKAIQDGTMEDYVDMLCLLLDSYRKRFPNLDTQTLLNFADEKQRIVIPARSWGQFNEKGQINHIIEDYD